MGPAVKQIIETRINYIENEEFDKLFKLVQDTFIPKTVGELGAVLESAGLQPIKYLDFIPEGYYFMNTMESYNVPENINKISYQSFAYSDLKQINIPGNVKVIEDEAFRSCDFLHTVRILDGVQSIGPYSFYGCEELTKVYLPQSLKYLGSEAFGETPLTEVHYEGTIKNFRSISNHESIFKSSNVQNIWCADGFIGLETII